MTAQDSGDVLIFAPLDLAHEIEQIVRDAENERAAQIFFERTGIRPQMGGAAGAWTFTNDTRTSILDGTFDFDTDTFLMALFLSTSNLGAATTTYAGVTNEHANANGYTTGGISMGVLALSGTTTVKVDDSVDSVWTASGGSIVGRWAAIYESGGKVVCYMLLDSAPADVTATDGNTLTVALHADGVFSLA